MKKGLLLLITLLCMMLCTAASADWTCTNVGRDGTVCNTVNQDGCEWCQWCGEDEPVHGLSTGMAGKNVVRLIWYGEIKEQAMLWWCVSGTEAWDMAEGITGTSYNLKGLEPGTAYDVMLMLADNSTVGPITVTTAADLTPTPMPTPTPTPVQLKVGQTITYGHYPQTESGTDNTPIEWQVLEVQGNKALLLSVYGLDAHRFDKNQYQGWAKSEVRAWLNSTFLSRAFTNAQQQAIVTTTVQTGNNDEWVAIAKKKGWVYTFLKGGEDTQDQLFLLSMEEAMVYGGYSTMEEFYRKGTSKLQAVPTKYAVKQGGYQYTGSNSSYKLGDAGCCWWWLRSPGSYGNDVSRVYYDGKLLHCLVSTSYGCIRPAFWLDLGSAAIN